MERREMDGEQQFVAPIWHASTRALRLELENWRIFSLLRITTLHRKANVHAMQREAKGGGQTLQKSGRASLFCHAVHAFFYSTYWKRMRIREYQMVAQYDDKPDPCSTATLEH
jgi:hypothetical protein